MQSHSSKEQDKSSKASAESAKSNQQSPQLSFQDNRAEAMQLKEMQEMADQSPQTKEAANLQAIANGGAHNQQAAQLHSIANNHNLQTQLMGKLEEEEPLQGKFSTIQRKEDNTGLPNNLKSGVESLSGHSMDDVKVHYNSSKPAQLQAHAYAQGTDIHLGPGQEQHLPHEAWHVVQQKQGRVQPTKQLKSKVNINDDAGLEKEADLMGAKALQMKVESSAAILNKAPKSGKKVAQLKGEFKSAFEANSGLAKAAVKTDLSSYQAYQTLFEQKLGVGLHRNELAMQGADIMLSKMKAAMIAAGFDDEKIKKSLAVKKGASKKVDLGGLLIDDVEEALDSGNLREKMGMVYQARFAISNALNDLRQMEDSGVELGDEIQSPEMGESIEEMQRENKAVSYAILSRRGSVSNQERTSNRKKKKSQITGDLLEDMGVPLSEREKRSSLQSEEDGTMDHRFVPGSQYYNVNEDKIKSERDQLRRVVAGLSGSTDMYFHIAKHLKMKKSERRKLRLAALGQMIVNNDHSFHEIMHVAKTQGGLDDYLDDLPIGYTELAPLNGEQVLEVTGLEDFPGDEQVRDVKDEGELETTKEDITSEGGKAARRANKYPAILRELDAYHVSPSIPSLEKIIELIDVWYEAKKPSDSAWKKTKKKWNESKRRIALEQLKLKCQSLLKIENEKLKMDLHSAKIYILTEYEVALEENKDTVKAKMLNFIDSYIAKLTEDANLGEDVVENDLGAQELAKKKKELENIKTYLNTSDVAQTTSDWKNKDFRASKSDLDMDLSDVNIDETGILKNYRDKENPAKGNLVELLEQGVNDSRKIMQELGKDVSSIPDYQEVPEFGSKFQERRWHKSQKEEVEHEISSRYSEEQDDFISNVDISMMDALQPRSPIENLLRQIEGKPMPQELQALQAYAQPGFYKIMNKVLNKSKDEKFMAQVPEDLKSLISLAVSGLNKMKPYKGGSVYRGEPGVKTSDVLNKYIFKSKDERQVIWNEKFNKNKTYSQFVSTSKQAHSSYITTANKWKAIEIRNVKTGVDISAVSNTFYEREVLFPPGTQFNVISVEDKFLTKHKDDVDGSITTSDEDNKYNEASIGSDQPGRIKIVMEEA